MGDDVTRSCGRRFSRTAFLSQSEMGSIFVPDLIEIESLPWSNCPAEVQLLSREKESRPGASQTRGQLVATLR